MLLATFRLRNFRLLYHNVESKLSNASTTACYMRITCNEYECITAMIIVEPCIRISRFLRVRPCERAGSRVCSNAQKYLNRYDNPGK